LVVGKERLNVDGRLIMCFLRHLDADDASEALDAAIKHKDKILGVGLDSGEKGNPPAKFKEVYARAIKEGFIPVAHAGEEGPAQYISEALDVLQVKRIDHGVRFLEDEKVVERLVKEQVPLTCCPCSNHKLQVYARYFNNKNVIGDLIRHGIKVTINSDDPAYFGGYIADNFRRTVNDCDLTHKQVYDLCKNSFEATFLSPPEKRVHLRELDSFYHGYLAAISDKQNKL